jgi:hypothetical protein
MKIVPASQTAKLQILPPIWMGVGLGRTARPRMTAPGATKMLCVGAASGFDCICPDGAAPLGMVSARLLGSYALTNPYDIITTLLLKESG